MYFNLANIIIFLIVGVLFTWAMLFASRLIQPRHPTPEKDQVYECAEVPLGGGRIRFNFRFYLVALIFLIFDVEIAFVFPVAAVFRRWTQEGRGMIAFGEIFVFVGILFLGLVYVWRKGDIDWKKEIPPEEGSAEA
ncbi:MAG: NADH-quinone oxidoreductase subunit A [Candidatus Eisenbacteria bacterium]